MAFCSNCGAEVQGRFCAKCGTPMSACSGSAARPGARTRERVCGSAHLHHCPRTPLPCRPPRLQRRLRVSLKTWPARCVTSWDCSPGYCSWCWRPTIRTGSFAFTRSNRYLLNIASIAIFIAISMIGVVSFLHFIPFLGTILALMLYPIVGLGFFILWLMLMYKAYNGERWVLPIIGPLAEKQA